MPVSHINGLFANSANLTSWASSTTSHSLPGYRNLMDSEHLHHLLKPKTAHEEILRSPQSFTPAARKRLNELGLSYWAFELLNKLTVNETRGTLMVNQSYASLSQTPVPGQLAWLNYDSTAFAMVLEFQSSMFKLILALHQSVNVAH